MSHSDHRAQLLVGIRPSLAIPVLDPNRSESEVIKQLNLLIEWFVTLSLDESSVHSNSMDMIPFLGSSLAKPV